MVDQLEKDKIDRIDFPGKRFLIYSQDEKVNSVPSKSFKLGGWDGSQDFRHCAL